MPNGAKHPFSGWLYEPHDPGTVKVTDNDGRWGIFDLDGRHIDGELREADGQTCHWIGGPRYANYRIGTPSPPDA
jgi:hypothetical protein